MTLPSLYILLTLNNAENLMSNNTINIALIGYGFVGKTFHAPLIRSVPGLNLAFVASRYEEKVKRDLPDVTVIAISTVSARKSASAGASRTFPAAAYGSIWART